MWDRTIEEENGGSEVGRCFWLVSQNQYIFIFRLFRGRWVGGRFEDNTTTVKCMKISYIHRVNLTLIRTGNQTETFLVILNIMIRREAKMTSPVRKEEGCSRIHFTTMKWTGILPVIMSA